MGHRRVRDRPLGLIPFLFLLLGGCGDPTDTTADASTADAGALDAAIPVDANDDGSAGGDAAASDAGDASAPREDAGGPHIFVEAAANPGEWTWIPIEGARCRDGSTAGIGLRTHVDGPGLILFMQGGGGCINGTTCDLNRSTFDEDDLAMWASGLGDNHIFNTSNGMNPVRDWHAAFIAYCTGDFHGGTRSGVDVPGGPTDQWFVGHHNMQLMTALLRDYFTDVEHVLLVGSSAGGFGTVISYVEVEGAFAPAPVTLLDDSGILLPTDQALSPCLQRRMRDLWGLDAALPSGCTACFSASGDGLSNLYSHLGTTYPDARFGLISATGDLVIRTFYGYGRNDCEPAASVPITVANYRMGLFALRSGLPANWGTYYSSGPLHAILASYPILSVDGVTLRSWVSELLAGEVSHVAPP